VEQFTVLCILFALIVLFVPSQVEQFTVLFAFSQLEHG
jgi:hypothetical protein